MDHWILQLLQLCRPAGRHGLSHSHSVSGCADASVSLSLSPGRRLDKFGHHRAACSRAGVLGTRDYPLECAALIRDLDFVEFNAFDNRRVEVIVHGLTLWQGAQLAIDTTLVSPLRGAALQTARRAEGRVRLVVLGRRGGRQVVQRETTYPELVLGAEEEPGWSFWPQRWAFGRRRLHTDRTILFVVPPPPLFRLTFFFLGGGGGPPLPPTRPPNSCAGWRKLEQRLCP